MAHDIFISHSAKDQIAADMACAVLERNGLRCWIAPRDVMPGTDWAASIIEAIGGSRAMVLVFSADANTSDYVHREVSLAVDARIAVLPMRIEDVRPTAAMKFHLHTAHWMDAITPPLEKHLLTLAQALRVILRMPNSEPILPPPISPAAAGSDRQAMMPANSTRCHIEMWLLSFVFFLALAAGLPRFTWLSPSGNPINANDAATIIQAARNGDARLRLHESRIFIVAREPDLSGLSGVMEAEDKGSRVFWVANGQWRFMDRGRFDTPLPVRSTILAVSFELGTNVAPDGNKTTTTTPLKKTLELGTSAFSAHESIRLEAIDGLRLNVDMPSAGTHPRDIKVLVVSKATSPMLDVSQGVLLILSLSCLVCGASRTRKCILNAHRAHGAEGHSALKLVHPMILRTEFWIAAMALVFLLLVVLKTCQRVSEEGSPVFDAFSNALGTRRVNHSTWALLAHFLAILSFSKALRESKVSPPTVKWPFILAIQLILTFSFLYLCAIYAAPDPGTFMTYKRGAAHFVQFIEGLITLGVVTAAGAWLSVAFYIVVQLKEFRDGDNHLAPGWRWVCCGVFAGPAILVISFVLGSIQNGFAIGNVIPALIAHSFLIGAIYVVALVFALFCRAVGSEQR